MSEQLLLFAVEQNDINQVTVLIGEAKANVNGTNRMRTSPLHIAAKNGSISVLEILLVNNANPDAKEDDRIGGYSPLHYAVLSKNEKSVETLLNHFANPNIQDSLGFTPLHLACRLGLLVITKLLIGKGANVHIGDNRGKPPAFWAREYKHHEIEKLLPKFQYNWKKHVGENQKLILYKDVPAKKKKKRRRRKKKKKN